MAELSVAAVSSKSIIVFFFFSRRRRHTRSLCDWSSDVCSSDLEKIFFRGKTEDDARLLVCWGNGPAGKFRQVFGDVQLLLVRRALDGFFRRHVGTRLNHVGIAEGAAAARAR